MKRCDPERKKLRSYEWNPEQCGEKSRAREAKVKPSEKAPHRPSVSFEIRMQRKLCASNFATSLSRAYTAECSSSGIPISTQNLPLFTCFPSKSENGRHLDGILLYDRQQKDHEFACPKVNTTCRLRTRSEWPLPSTAGNIRDMPANAAQMVSTSLSYPSIQQEGKRIT